MPWRNSNIINLVDLGDEISDIPSMWWDCHLYVSEATEHTQKGITSAKSSANPKWIAKSVPAKKAAYLLLYLYMEGKYRNFLPCPNVLEDTEDLSSCTIIIRANKCCGGERGRKEGKSNVMNLLNFQSMKLCVLSQESWNHRASVSS